MDVEESIRKGRRKVEVILKLFVVFALLLSVLLFFFDIRKGYSSVGISKETENGIGDGEWEEFAVALED